MSKKVTIITLVSLAGPDMSLTAGDEWEVDEAVAEARIALGLARLADPPADPDEEPDDEPEERQTVTHGGQDAETAAVRPDAETRTPRRKPRQRR